MNRHGLIAGATGTGKTRTLQLIAEQLSDAGVAVFAADYKGDLSGLLGRRRPRGRPRSGCGPRLPHEPAGYPVELLSLGGIGPGVPVRASVTDFGPQLLAKVLGANETQESSLALVFRFADEHGLALVDLADLRALLAYLDSDAGKQDLKGIGGVSKPDVGVLLRSLVELEDGGGTEFFGEPQLEIADLLRAAPDGRGVDLVPRAAAVQDQARGCSRPCSCGCSPSCSSSCRRSATSTSRSSSSSSTRRTCSSTRRPRRSWSRSSGPCA